MKKIIVILITLFTFTAGYAQTDLMQASIGAGDSLGRIKIYLKPSNTVLTSASFSTLQFNIALPAAIAPGPNFPVLTVKSSPFAGVTWIVSDVYLENGYVNYNILTAQSAFTLPVTNNVEFEAMQVEFSPGLSGIYNTFTNAAHLVCQPDGGSGGLGVGNALFYCTGTFSSNGANLYYARDGQVTVSNGSSYTPIGPGSRLGGGPNPLSVLSFARFAGGIFIPVKFTNFSVIKKANDALLTWSVENETSITDRYEIERSVNGADFTKFITIAPRLNGGTNTYNLTDLNLSSIKSSGVIYYRVKQIDKDGKFIYSEIRSVRLDSRGFGITVYPNPVSSLTNVTLDLDAAADVIIKITDVAGKEVQRIQLRGNKGINIQKVNLSGLAAGSYMLNVTAGTEIKTLPVVKVN